MTNSQPTATVAPAHPPVTDRIDVDALKLPRVRTATVLLLALAFVAMLGGLFMLGWYPQQKREAALQQEARQQASAAILVQTAYPASQSNAVPLVLPGATVAMQETALFPRANGYLAQLHADIGDHVKQGQILAHIATPEVDAQLTQTLATQRLQQAQAGRLKTDLDLAQATFERYQGLAQTGGVTRQMLDERHSARDQAQAALKSGEAALAAADADVQRLSAMRDFENIIAPFDGTISARNYDLGALLSASNTGPGAEIFHLVATDTLRVFADVPQSYALLVKTGDTAEFAVTNYPGRSFAGRVVRTTSAIDPATRSLRFELHFPNSDHSLFPGMYGQVRFNLRDANPPPTIPSSALLLSAQGMRVAVVRDDKVAYQTIKLGRDFGTTVEVVEGLSGHDQVVLNPSERLTEGAAVQVVNPPPAPAVSTAPAPRASRAPAGSP
jgi:RND family efflux transporter MFP subunit